MGGFVDSLGGAGTDSRHHSTGSKIKDGQDKKVGRPRRNKERRPSENRHKEQRHGEDLHKEQPQSEDHHSKLQHIEKQHREHRHKEPHNEEHHHEEHHHEKHQHKEGRRHNEDQHKEHRPKEHQAKEKRHEEHRHKESQHGQHKCPIHGSGDHDREKHQHEDKQEKARRQKTEAELKRFRKKLFDAALLPFHENSGSSYPCLQSEIDFHRRGVFDEPNTGPFVSTMQATEEVMRWNDERRAPPGDELVIIRTLCIAVHEAEKNLRFGPDLAIKAFADLDRVFFGGRLRGHVFVQWVDQTVTPKLAYGETISVRLGQCRINLNAHIILLRQLKGDEMNPIGQMLGTLLHEMVHSYQRIRSPDYRRQPNWHSHDEHFGTIISVVHDRAVRILGTWAIENGKYKQHFFLPREEEQSRDGHCSGGCNKSKDAGSERKETGVKKEARDRGARKGNDCIVM